MAVPDRDRSPFSTPGRYQPMSAVASCPAATGERAPGTACAHFPDTSHRCGKGRSHFVDGDPEHRCTCGAKWLSLVTGLPTK